MNNENELNAVGQPATETSAETPQNNPQSNAVQPEEQVHNPVEASPFQNTEPLSPPNSSQQDYASQGNTQTAPAAPTEQIPVQGNIAAEQAAYGQSQQTAAPQGAPASQPQYQPQSQQSAPTRTMGEQQYQSQTNAGSGYYGQNGTPYSGGGSTPPAGNYSRTKGFAIASLICGICSVVFCCLGFLALLAGIAAIVFGILVLSDTDKNGALYPDTKTMRGLAIAGLVCGIVGTIFGLFALIGIPSILSFMHDGPFDDFDSFGPYMDF